MVPGLFQYKCCSLVISLLDSVIFKHCLAVLESQLCDFFPPVHPSSSWVSSSLSFYNIPYYISFSNISFLLIMWPKYNRFCFATNASSELLGGAIFSNTDALSKWCSHLVNNSGSINSGAICCIYSSIESRLHYKFYNLCFRNLRMT